MKGRYDGEGLGMVGGKNTIPNPSDLPSYHSPRRDEAHTSKDEAQTSKDEAQPNFRLKRSVVIV